MVPKRATNSANTSESSSIVKRLKTTDKHDEDHHKLSEFLDSMTFAHRDDDCECDECNLPENSSLPAPAKKLALDYNSSSTIKQAKNVKPQKRVFVVRDNLTGISIWKWILPVQQSKPLLEFGNSHRIVYVDKLAKNTKISSSICNDNSIMEKPTDWIESCAYFLPSGTQNAMNDKNSSTENLGLGWVCNILETNSKGENVHLDEINQESQQDSSVMIMIKIPPEKLEINLNQMESENKFYSGGMLSSIDRKILFDIFRQCNSDHLSQESVKTSIDENGMSTKIGATSIALSNKANKDLKKVLEKFT